MLNSLKIAVMFLLDRTVVPVFRYLSMRVQHTDLADALVSSVQMHAIESAVRYAEEKMTYALMFKTRVELWDYVLEKVRPTGLCAEFGVWKGDSINYFARKLPTVYGFDSFEGLKEEWTGWAFAKGTFDRKGKLPQVRKNVFLLKGWFDVTVPPFLAQHPEPFSFVHIDCDTYESTELVLNLLGSRLLSGTVVIFDEYFGYRGWELGEFKAWIEYTQQTGTSYKYLAFSMHQVAVQIV